LRVCPSTSARRSSQRGRNDCDYPSPSERPWLPVPANLGRVCRYGAIRNSIDAGTAGTSTGHDWSDKAPSSPRNPGTRTPRASAVAPGSAGSFLPRETCPGTDSNCEGSPAQIRYRVTHGSPLHIDTSEAKWIALYYIQYHGYAMPRNEVTSERRHSQTVDRQPCGRMPCEPRRAKALRRSEPDLRQWPLQTLLNGRLRFGRQI
jgi:hypothetical protein